MADDTGIRSLTLTTDDGVHLEAELAAGVGPPLGAVVLAHPHPLHGGSMRSLVTSELFRTLPDAGVTVMRFNFRGVGASTGEHGHGLDERLDVQAAIDAVVAVDPVGPLVLCGWSFGADVALSVPDPRLAGWVLIAPPLRFRPAADPETVGLDPRPKLLVVPEHDEFRSPASAAEATAGWRATTVETVPGADHFLVGRTAVATRLLVAFLADVGAH